MSLGELPLHHTNERFDIGRTWLRSTERLRQEYMRYVLACQIVLIYVEMSIFLTEKPARRYWSNTGVSAPRFISLGARSSAEPDSRSSTVILPLASTEVIHSFAKPWTEAVDMPLCASSGLKSTLGTSILRGSLSA